MPTFTRAMRTAALSTVSLGETVDTLRLMTVPAFIERMWEDEILPTLTDYIRIPNKSPHFDPDWEKHGHMDKAVALFETWSRKKIAILPGATLEVVRLAGRTPLIFMEIPGEAKGE